MNNAKLTSIAKWILYPLFYLFCLLVCVYVTFPWDKVKERIVAEFAKSQATKGDKAWRLEIGELSGYFITGIELEQVKIVFPPDDDEKKTASSRYGAASRSAADEDEDGGDAHDAGGSDGKKALAKKPRESSIVIDHAHVRVRILPLLIGRVRMDFGADLLGGHVSGTIPKGSGTLEIEMSDVNLAEVAPLRDLVKSPVQGIASGKIELTNADGKWNKTNGSLDIKVADVSICDGKSKCFDQVTLPIARIGNLEIVGKATDGVLAFEKFGATGKDVDILAEGSLRIKEPWDSSSLDLVIRFAFSDEFKNKDDKTKVLFVQEAGSPIPPLFENNSKIKKAKREDGFYGFRGKGALKRLKWDPTTDDSPTKANAAKADTSSASKKKPTTPASPRKSALDGAKPSAAEKSDKSEKSEKNEEPEPMPREMPSPPPQPEKVPDPEPPPPQPVPEPPPPEQTPPHEPGAEEVAPPPAP